MGSCKASLDWTYRGMRTLVLENDRLRIIILLDKGSDIMELTYKPRNVDFMWHSTIGYRNPGSFVPSSNRPAGSFLDFYGGGWQDVLPIAGSGPVTHRGAEWGMHGETPLLPWECHLEKDGRDEVVARLTVQCCRYPFKVEKWITLQEGRSSFTIREKLTNLSPQELEFSWLQHPAFGEPLIAPGTRLDVPATKGIISKASPASRLKGETTFTWPFGTGKDGGQIDLSVLPEREIRAEETIFLTDFSGGWYAITNPKLKLGFALSWDLKVYPYLWFWQNFNLLDYPFYGRDWNIALEPSTSYPTTFAEQLKNGTAATIKGHSSLEVSITGIAYDGLSRVERVAADGTVQGN